MEAGEPADHSIYHASGTWRNRNGEEVSLSNLQGRIQVVSMLYTNCDYACPRILADMKRIESALSDEEREQTNFLIVSIDPERDTPDRLRSEEHTSELQSRGQRVCRLLLVRKKLLNLSTIR